MKISYLRIASFLASIVWHCEAIKKIDTTHSPQMYYEVEVEFANNHGAITCDICWLPSSARQKGVCETLGPQQSVRFDTSVGYLFNLNCQKLSKKIVAGSSASDIPGVLSATFEIIGGKHIYNTVDILTKASRELGMLTLSQSNFVRVLTPDECDRQGFDVLGPTWRDAIRVAAYRHNVSLCFCGSFNESTTYTADMPNEQLPLIHYGSDCGCDRSEDGDHEFYHYWMPCGFFSACADQLADAEMCNVPGSLPTTFPYKSWPKNEHKRLQILHSTIYDDRLSMKHKTWESLKRVFGTEKASLVMPKSFYSWYSADHQELMKSCQELIDRNAPPEDRVFIVKAEDLHRQLGIYIATADHLVSQRDNFNRQFGFATVFLPRPYTIHGYKLNIRRYLVAVCVGGHLRGYVHDDGKNIYTKKPYRELTDTTELRAAEQRGDEKAIRERLDELITTGYVSESHYDDKPLSGLEFFQYARDQGQDPTYFMQSMWTRLALALHVSVNDGDYDLCSTTPVGIPAPALPSCLENSIRFMHFGCDFNVDASLNGYESRMFECNKGPDFSVHYYRDGKMKREVAADIVSFLGFEGEFDGSPEAARKYRMNKIYDSNDFDPNAAFAFLESLKDKDVKTSCTVGSDEL